MLSPRVDPTAVCEKRQDTPMEISANSEKSSPEMRRLLGKFTEMPLLIKFFHLASLISADGDLEEFDSHEKGKDSDENDYFFGPPFWPHAGYHNGKTLAFFGTPFT